MPRFGNPQAEAEAVRLNYSSYTRGRRPDDGRVILTMRRIYLLWSFRVTTVAYRRLR